MKMTETQLMLLDEIARTKIEKTHEISITTEKSKTGNNITIYDMGEHHLFKIVNNDSIIFYENEFSIKIKEEFEFLKQFTHDEELINILKNLDY